MSGAAELARIDAAIERIQSATEEFRQALRLAANQPEPLVAELAKMAARVEAVMPDPATHTQRAAIALTPQQEAYEKVQWALAGHTVPDAIGAVTHSLAAAVGFSSNSPEEADQTIDSLAADAKRGVRTNWGYLQDMKRAAAAPPAGEA